MNPIKALLIASLYLICNNTIIQGSLLVTTQSFQPKIVTTVKNFLLNNKYKIGFGIALLATKYYKEISKKSRIDRANRFILAEHEAMLVRIKNRIIFLDKELIDLASKEKKEREKINSECLDYLQQQQAIQEEYSKKYGKYRATCRVFVNHFHTFYWNLYDKFQQEKQNIQELNEETDYNLNASNIIKITPDTDNVLNFVHPNGPILLPLMMAKSSPDTAYRFPITNRILTDKNTNYFVHFDERFDERLIHLNRECFTDEKYLLKNGYFCYAAASDNLQRFFTYFGLHGCNPSGGHIYNDTRTTNSLIFEGLLYSLLLEVKKDPLKTLEIVKKAKLDLDRGKKFLVLNLFNFIHRKDLGESLGVDEKSRDDDYNLTGPLLETSCGYNKAGKIFEFILNNLDENFDELVKSYNPDPISMKTFIGWYIVDNNIPYTSKKH